MKQGGTLALVAAVFVFFGGIYFGLKLVTAEAEVTPTGPTCENRTVAEGEELTSNLVTVDVYNASRTAGLADRISRDLQARNFLPGEISNNPTDFTTDDVLIVGADGEDPRVQLVMQQFRGEVGFQEGTVEGSDGVAILLGGNYADRNLVKDAPQGIEANREVTACVPIAPVA